jgi:hypothetical protein
MKQTLSMLLLAAILITSCKKASNSKPTTTEPKVLLTKIINNTAGDPYVGKTLAEFTYNGKQLSQAVIYSYSATPDIETDLFNYDSQGHLTGTTISHTLSRTYNDVSSTVTYTGSNIGEIKFYKAGNVLDKDVTISHQNGKVSNWLNSNEVNDTYSYDNSGHITSELAVEYLSGKPDGSQNVVSNSTFDDKSNLTQAIPLWIYFRVYNEDQSFGYTPGTNNPVAATDGGTNFTYGYQYNTYGYPSTISWTDQYAQSYKYEYTQVN